MSSGGVETRPLFFPSDDLGCEHLTAIIKTPSSVDLRELYIAAMFALYMRAPARPTREEVRRGAITHLGEIGSVREKNWTRTTPYSPARRAI